MNDLLDIARELQSFCDRQGWNSCVIGGLAVLRWGEPRVTRDVDLTLLTGFGTEESFVRVLLAEYPARVADPIPFARKNRVLLLQTVGGVGIDISLGALPFEECIVRNATDYAYSPGLSFRTCSAEDLVVMKLFASRPMDIRDAESVVFRHHERLDWTYIEAQLGPLVELKEEPEILLTLARLKAALDRLGQELRVSKAGLHSRDDSRLADWHPPGRARSEEEGNSSQGANDAETNAWKERLGSFGAGAGCMGMSFD